MFVERRGSKWRGRYRDLDGKLRSSGTFNTKEEALSALELRVAGLELPHENDEFSHIPSMTLTRYFREHWLNYPYVAPSTQQKYEGLFRRYIEPFIGDREVSSITRRDARNLIRPYIAEGRHHLAGNIKAVIGSVFRALVDEEYVLTNPAHGIRIKRVDPEPFIPIMPEDFHKILKNLPGENCRFLAVFLAGTGLRWGEATGVKVSDFDPNTNELRIVRRIMRLTKDFAKSDSRFRIVPTTKSGYNRIVPVSSELSLAIIDYVERNQLDGDSFIFRHSDVFDSPPIDLDNVQWEKWHKTFTRAVKDAGFDGRRWTTHALRHANATLLVASGVDVVEIQRRLGHRSIDTTQRYMHRVKASQSKAAEATDAFIPSGDVS